MPITDFIDTVITQWENPPQRGQPQSLFVPLANNWTGVQMPRNVTETMAVVDEMNFLGEQMNSTADEVRELSQTALAISSFLGDWSDLSGVLAPPAMVAHPDPNGRPAYWFLQQPIDDVSAVEPGTDEAYWVFVYDALGVTYVDSEAGILTSVSIATREEYLSAAIGKVLSAGGVWASAVPVQLPSSGSLAVDMSAGINFFTTPTGAITLDNPTNAKAGQSGSFDIDNSGGYQISFGTRYLPPNATPPSLETSGRYLLAYQVLHDLKIAFTINYLGAV